MNFTPLNLSKPPEVIENLTPIKSQNLPEIRKVMKYKKLLKILKEGKYISARITAKALGLNKDTVLDWIKTPKALKSVINEIDKSVAVMKQSEDWRSHDRLIQYATGSEDKAAQGIGSNILIINNGKEYRIEENTA